MERVITMLLIALLQHSRISLQSARVLGQILALAAVESDLRIVAQLIERSHGELQIGS